MRTRTSSIGSALLAPMLAVSLAASLRAGELDPATTGLCQGTELPSIRPRCVALDPKSLTAPELSTAEIKSLMPDRYTAVDRYTPGDRSTAVERRGQIRAMTHDISQL